MKKNKILIITPGFLPLFGGMEEQCYLLAKSFVRRGIAVDILTEQTSKEFQRQEIIDGANVFRVRYVQKRDIFGYSSIAFDLIVFLIKNRNEYDFCIIRTLTYHAVVVGVLKFLKLFSTKTFVTAETGGENDDVVSLKNRKFFKMILFFLNKHDFLNSICIDNYVHYQELGFEKNKLTRIYNGIEIKQYLKNEYPEVLNKFLFLGRLNKAKGVYELLNAFKKVVKTYPQKKLFIGGDGDEKRGMIEFIEKNKLEENIIYEGFISNEKKEQFYAKGDCLVLPSYSEGFPISILEATVRKKTIIVTDVSDLKEVYGNRIVFCKKRDAEDLYEKMLYSIEKFDLATLNYDEIIKKMDIGNITDQIVHLMEFGSP